MRASRPEPDTSDEPRSPDLSRRALGRWGEERAASHYRRHGYTVLDRNWRSATGELDLVVHRDGVIVFSEVKTRRDDGYGPAAAAGWLQADHGLLYMGSLTAQHGQPVVDLAEGRWVDDGSLLGRTYLNVRLANGVQLSDVRPNSLTPAPTPVDLPAPRMAHPPLTAAVLPAARTTPTAARGPALT